MSIKKYNSGMSLVEVMIIVIVMALIGLGIATLYKNMMERYKYRETVSKIKKFRDQLENIIKNENNWIATISHPSNSSKLQLTCQLDGPPNCADGSHTDYFNIAQDDGSGGSPLFYPGFSNTTGLTLDAEICNTFPSQACPIQYIMVNINHCSNGAATCPHPDVEIFATFHKAPGISNSIVNRLDDRLAQNGGTLSLQINRGERVRYEPFEIVQLSATGAGPTTPPASGGGGCTSLLNWNARPLSLVTKDPSNLVTFNNPADTFSVGPGVYECSVSAEGFDQVQGFKIQLADLTTPANSQVIGSAITQNDASATIFGKVKLRLQQPVNVLQVRHYCVVASDFASPLNSDMGRPMPDYTQPTVFTRVYCSRSL